MTTPPNEPRTGWWRSRWFVQPLLVTTIGLLASVGLYYALLGPAGGPCSYGPDACAYSMMGRFGQALTLLPVLLVGLLITGLVVGLTSRHANLAFGAALVGVFLTPLVGVVAFLVPVEVARGQADSIVGDLAGAMFIGLLVLIPVAPGFAVGRLLRRSRSDPSNAKGLQ